MSSTTAARRVGRALLVSGLVVGVGFGVGVWRWGFFRVPSLSVELDAPVEDRLLDAAGHNRVLAPSLAAYLVRAEDPSGGRLYYLGARHVVGPDDPQIERIVTDWATFRPTLALVEGHLGLYMGGVRRGADMFGESGAVYALARDAGVPVHSLEPFPEDHTRALAEATDPGAAATLLAITFASANAERPYSDADIEEGLRKRAVGVLAGVFEDATAFDAAWQKRWAADEGDWRSWAGRRYEHVDPPPLERVSQISSRIRDAHMVRLVAERVRAGDHVFAVVGRSHVAVQEPALRHLLPDASFSTEFLEETWVDR